MSRVAIRYRMKFMSYIFKLTERDLFRYINKYKNYQLCTTILNNVKFNYSKIIFY